MIITISNRIVIADAPEGLRQILACRFRIPNPKWLENQRMGRWNGSTPEYLEYMTETEENTLEIPRGFARQLLLLCQRHQMPYTLVDQRRTLPPVHLPFKGTLKPFQDTACSAMLQKEFGTLTAPTGAGKTVMGIYLIAARQQPALVMVHTRDLALQWVDRIHHFTGIDIADIGLVGAGKFRIGKQVTVGLVQSVYKRAEEISPHIGHIVVDECHRTPSRTFTDAVMTFDARYSLGLTATMFRRDKLTQLIFWHLGDNRHTVDARGLVEQGDILQARVFFRETAFTPHSDPARHYSRMLSELTQSDDRNRLIAEDVARELEQSPGICLILSDRKQHCQTLKALLRFRHHVEAALLTGDQKTQERQDVLSELASGNLRVLIATGQLVGEGFDCPDLSTLFLATPIRFGGRVLQYLGRILRPSPGKKQARVFDYVDVHVDVLVKAAMARRRIYQGASPAEDRH